MGPLLLAPAHLFRVERGTNGGKWAGGHFPIDGLTTRRDFLIAAGGLVGGLNGASVCEPAHATPAAMQDALRKVTGGAQIRSGKVKLELPPLIDNGNSVALSVAVESPMTPS